VPHRGRAGIVENDTARRRGAADAVIVYRRTDAQMPAHDVEVEEAADEGEIYIALRDAGELGV
jgi:hypothetical protein